jgi:hypothetical protein
VETCLPCFFVLHIFAKYNKYITVKKKEKKVIRTLNRRADGAAAGTEK